MITSFNLLLYVFAFIHLLVEGALVRLVFMVYLSPNAHEKMVIAVFNSCNLSGVDTPSVLLKGNFQDLLSIMMKKQYIVVRIVFWFVGEHAGSGVPRHMLIVIFLPVGL